jgi:FMN phosphatase YigB (HAD superfamily)
MIIPHTLLAIDFDETLVPTYRCSVPVWDAYLAKWLVTHGHYPTLEDARANMKTFENPYGCGPTFMARQFGHKKAWIEAFYMAVSPHLLEANIAGNVQVDPALKSELVRLQGAGYVPIIISQGHRDFILPLLKYLDLADVFLAQQVIDRAHKKLEPHGYQLAKYLNSHLPLQRFIMADDSAYNFAHAKAEGFETVLITPTPKADDVAMADSHASDIVAFLKRLS